MNLDEYLKWNPNWHSEDAAWKVSQIVRMMRRHKLSSKRICDVGCGSGDVLKQLQSILPDDCLFWGYDTAPYAIGLCKAKENESLHFELKDIVRDDTPFFDLILIIDVVEHIEDYYGFLRALIRKGAFKIFHIPLDISLQSVLRPKYILSARDKVRHIHYFTKELALRSLREIGYEVLDYFYTTWLIDCRPKSKLSVIAKLASKILFPLNQDLTVRIFGGSSLMVLAK